MNPLNTNSVKKLVLKNTLKSHYSVSALIDLIVKQVKEIPDYLKLKQDLELILMICTMIETICTDSEVSIDKLEAIRGVHNQVFEMTTDDHLLLDNKIKHLFIKKAPFLPRERFLVGLLKWRSISVSIRLVILLLKIKFKISCCIIIYTTKYTL